jgi:hypothetical protein
LRAGDDASATAGTSVLINKWNGNGASLWSKTDGLSFAGVATGLANHLSPGQATVGELQFKVPRRLDFMEQCIVCANIDTT